MSASPECAVRYLEVVSEFDVRELLAQVRTPTLVVHTRDDRQVPVKLGREIAAGIPARGLLRYRAKTTFCWSRTLVSPNFLRK
jgi:pimeloyl-ACP methyl ester carboxylesterase